MANAFDDITPDPTQVQTSAPASGNAFDDITPPVVIPKAKPPATAADRVQAGEAGILKGAAYLATLPADTVANAYHLQEVGLGAGQALLNHFTTGGEEDFKVPGSNLYHWVDPKTGLTTYGAHPPPPGATKVPIAPDAPTFDAGSVSPAGEWLTRQMDKNDVTSTQPNRLDDPTSRYLAAAGSAVPGVLAGGETLPNTVRSLVTAAPAAAAGQFATDKTGNAGAGIAAQIAASVLGPRGKGALLPENQIKNDAVQSGQDAGYVFPPATTNPNVANRGLESMAGKQTMQQMASVKNQPVTNSLARQDMGLTPSGAAITDADIKQAKLQAAPAYDALRGAGQISTTPAFGTAIDNALRVNQGASRLAPSLADTKLQTTLGELKANKAFDANDAVDTISMLRDKASEAFSSGNSNAGKAYRGASSALEDAMDSHLANSANPNDWDLLQNYRAARQTFAKIATVEDARDGTTGNVVAAKIAAAIKNGEPISGNLQTVGRAAGQAPLAFKQPTNSPGVNHLGLWGSAIGGAMAAHEFLPADWSHVGMATAAAVPAARALSRAWLFGPGQSGALPRSAAPVLPGTVLGAVTSQPLTGQSAP